MFIELDTKQEGRIELQKFIRILESFTTKKMKKVTKPSKIEHIKPRYSLNDSRAFKEDNSDEEAFFEEEDV